MLSNKHVKFQVDSLTVEGYSVAGEETVISIPELNLCFDIGRCPEHALLMDNLLLSHGHMDHSAGIGYYFSQRGFREMSPGTALVPAEFKEKLERLLDIWGEIDGNRPPANIIGLNPGDEYQLRRGLFAQAFETNHSRGSLGYTIIDRRNKLKSEYAHLNGPEIAKLRQSGQEVTYVLDVPLVTYLGDTMPGDYMQLEHVRNSQVLITECTFTEPDHMDRALAGRHIHVSQLADMLKECNNEHVIITHLSRRTFIRDAKRVIKSKFAPEIYKKVIFFMERQKKAALMPDEIK
ncbi:MAG: hypothetical protein JW745_09650 [Sedimentisphaerales bacterium]|nr:hypothetical protein [Sedimentisphaerales bacterium]MBN2842941.1 hypothetical protein [Sedimentisphaerales bacterium]